MFIIFKLNEMCDVTAYIRELLAVLKYTEYISAIFIIKLPPVTTEYKTSLVLC